MEKGHNQSQPLNHLPTAPPVDRRTPQQQAMIHLAQLLKTHPMAFWGGLWASLLLVMMVSLSSLLSPGSPGRMASGAAFGSSSTRTAQEVQQKSRVPIWLFGAIALSCTAGSILVSKQLTRPAGARPIAQPRPAVRPASPPTKPRVRKQAPKRLKPYSPVEAPLPNLRPSSPQANQPVRSPKPAQLPPKLTPSSLYPPKRVARPVPPPVMVQPAQVSVTVVPDDENHPLDWGTASLADAVDLRKRRSLADWMADPPNLG